MAGLKAVSLFLLGMLAVLGVAAVAAAHIEPGEIAVKFGTLNTFQAGVLLLVIGLVGSIEVAKGRRPRRLRTIMVGIALLSMPAGSVRRIATASRTIQGTAIAVSEAMSNAIKYGS